MDPQGDSGTGLRPERLSRIREAVHHVGYGSGTYEIRWAEDKDWIPCHAYDLEDILKFEAVDYTEEGIRNFYDFITDEHLYKSFLQEDTR